MAWKTLDSERAWALDYAFDKKGAMANCCAIKLRDGELMILSPALGVSEADFSEIEKHGRPVALVATNGFHHLGLPEWHKRYPAAKLYASTPAAARITKKHNGQLGAFEPLAKLSEVCPSDVVILEPPNMRIPDVMARVSTSGGWLWSFNDTVMNIPIVPPGLFGKIMKWTDSVPGFKVARFFTMMSLKDKPGFKRWFLAELEKAPPARVITGHGPPILDGAVASQLPSMVQAAI
jgi:hypothetical protein